MASKSLSVLLRQDVKGFGKAGEVKRAAAGFARNYLLPKRLAVEATAAIVAQAEASAKRKTAKAAGTKAASEKTLAGLAGKTVTIKAKAGEKGKLFGSVSNRDIAAALKEQHSVSLPATAIALKEPIKTLGKHDVPLHVAADVKGTLTVQIVSAKN